MQQHTLFWFRRDLRLHDNKALFYALKEQENVIPVFIFDTEIIDSLPLDDARISFIHSSLQEIQKQLNSRHRSLWVYKGKPLDVLERLTQEMNISHVYCNKDHEPYGISRDEKVNEMLDKKKIGFHQYLDHLIFDKNEILKNDNTPYQVFTPFAKKSKEVFSENHLKHYPSEEHLSSISLKEAPLFPALDALGFDQTTLPFPEKKIPVDLLAEYHNKRDFPAMQGTSRLGVHLRFGTISIRSLAQKAEKANPVYFNELLWREFYAQILWHFPQVEHQSFKPQYDRIQWRNNEKEFELWKEGKTGYPIVDAGMRELSKTGYMHNRVRMITASFLCKHLLIDWRWGESWFAEKLLDYELSSNNGGWQWSAGTGVDAAPYFRIFNPSEQQKKFDAKAVYIQKWVSEINRLEYPKPIVDHKKARERCLKQYKEALSL